MALVPLLALCFSIMCQYSPNVFAHLTLHVTFPGLDDVVMVVVMDMIMAMADGIGKIRLLTIWGEMMRGVG